MDQDLNITLATMKLLEGNTGKTLQDIGIGNEFIFVCFDNTSTAMAKMVKLHKQDFIKFRSFYTTRTGRSYLQATCLTKNSYPEYIRNIKTQGKNTTC